MTSPKCCPLGPRRARTKPREDRVRRLPGEQRGCPGHPEARAPAAAENIVTNSAPEDSAPTAAPQAPRPQPRPPRPPQPRGPLNPDAQGRFKGSGQNPRSGAPASPVDVDAPGPPSPAWARGPDLPRGRTPAPPPPGGQGPRESAPTERRGAPGLRTLFPGGESPAARTPPEPRREVPRGPHPRTPAAAPRGPAPSRPRSGVPRAPLPPRPQRRPAGPPALPANLGAGSPPSGSPRSGSARLSARVARAPGGRGSEGERAGPPRARAPHPAAGEAHGPRARGGAARPPQEPSPKVARKLEPRAGRLLHNSRRGRGARAPAGPPPRPRRAGSGPAPAGTRDRGDPERPRAPPAPPGPAPGAQPRCSRADLRGAAGAGAGGAAAAGSPGSRTSRRPAPPRAPPGGPALLRGGAQTRPARRARESAPEPGERPGAGRAPQSRASAPEPAAAALLVRAWAFKAPMEVRRPEAREERAAGFGGEWGAGRGETSAPESLSSGPPGDRLPEPSPSRGDAPLYPRPPGSARYSPVLDLSAELSPSMMLGRRWDLTVHPDLQDGAATPDPSPARPGPSAALRLSGPGAL
ncbi:basic salivary proline-rich protein 1-like [Talpa occidentalis]|uniref:basic salivary proline-rich protein 1-like n=1 Tax=Talpa occidentalis TaxID=50954 RepID=UPI00188EC723|nr:basic salivary proline-rich protein 1-like [Talpa occidentalis]